MTITALGAYKRVLKMRPGKIKIKEIRSYEAKNDINGSLHLKLSSNKLLFKYFLKTTGVATISRLKYGLIGKRD